MQPRLNGVVAVEALLMIAAGLEGQGKSADLHRLGHLLYLADKLHLERYGRVLSGERYHALRYGPTPSSTYGSLKILANRDPGVVPPETFLKEMAGAFSHTSEFAYRALRPPRLEYLSVSARKCIDEVLAMSCRWDFSDLTEATHDEAYGAVWSRNANGAIPVEVIAGTLENGQELLEYLRDPFPG